MPSSSPSATTKFARPIFQSLQTQGERFAIACRPKAMVVPNMTIGPGSIICAGAETLARKVQQDELPKGVILVHFYGQSANIDPNVFSGTREDVRLT